MLKNETNTLALKMGTDGKTGHIAAALKCSGKRRLVLRREPSECKGKKMNEDLHVGNK